MTFEDKDEEVKFWKAAAIYLAHCHAATAESVTRHGMRGLSDYDRKRILDIAGICYVIMDSNTAEELHAQKEQVWAFLSCLEGDDLERERKNVAKRARKSIED